MNNRFISFILLALAPFAVSSRNKSELSDKISIADSKKSILFENENNSFFQVELASLSATVQNDSVLVQWVSFWELNNQHFEVQRSSNAREWQVIAVVKGAGTSNVDNNYLQIDPEPLRGQSFYRLKQVDADGISRFSKTIAIYYSSTNRARSIHPSASGGTFVIKTKPGNYRKMDLFSATGDRIIFSYSITDDGDTKINLNRMPSGVYTLRIYGIISPSFVKLVKE
jgi:hypothetical protein